MDCKKVMIIDDETDIREGLATVLEYEGYSISSAQNGREALDLLLNNLQDLPDLIILDLMMPIMDGHSFLSEIHRLHPTLQKIPIIVVSANLKSAHEVSEKFSIPKLSKPIDLDLLYSSVKKYSGKI